MADKDASIVRQPAIGAGAGFAVETAEAGRACPACGAPIEGIEAIESIEEWEIDGLVGLYGGRYDRVVCTACHLALPVSRGVALRLGDRLLAVAPTWKGQAIPSAQLALLAFAQILPDLASLRSEAWSRIVDNAKPLLPLEELGAPRTASAKLKDWERLTPEAFAGAALLLAFGVSEPTGTVLRDLANVPGIIPLGRLQGSTWARLCMYAGRRVRGHPLGVDQRRIHLFKNPE